MVGRYFFYPTLRGSAEIGRDARRSCHSLNRLLTTQNSLLSLNLHYSAGFSYFFSSTETRHGMSLLKSRLLVFPFSCSIAPSFYRAVVPSCHRSFVPSCYRSFVLSLPRSPMLHHHRFHITHGEGILFSQPAQAFAGRYAFGQV